MRPPKSKKTVLAARMIKAQVKAGKRVLLLGATGTRVVPPKGAR